MSNDEQTNVHDSAATHCYLPVHVELDEVEAAIAVLRRVNIARLEDIRWTKSGVPVAVKASDVDVWKFIGLSNVSFAEHSLISG